MPFDDELELYDELELDELLDDELDEVLDDVPESELEAERDLLCCEVPSSIF